jgi:nucleoside-diphosphate-sugar epimerase
MNIIVLGGNGFIGKNLIKILDNSCKNFSRSKGFNLLDLYQTKQVFKLLAPDVIFNLASHGGSLHYVSKFAADVIDDNLSMYLNLYKAIKELPKKPMVINPISNCAYPGNSSIQMEQDWLNGEVHDSVMAFGNSKRALYHISKCYYKQYGIRSVNLIFPNAFGIYDHLDPNKTHALDGMIIRMLQAKQRVAEKLGAYFHDVPSLQELGEAPAATKETTATSRGPLGFLENLISAGAQVATGVTDIIANRELQKQQTAMAQYQASRPMFFGSGSDNTMLWVLGIGAIGIGAVVLLKRRK